MMTVIIKQQVIQPKVVENLIQTRLGSKIIQRLRCSASNFAVSSSGGNMPGRKLLDDINQTKDLSTMLSILEGKGLILSQTIILAAIKKISEIYQRDYNFGYKFNEEDYSRAFQSLSSIIDDFDVKRKNTLHLENSKNVSIRSKQRFTKDEISKKDILQAIKNFQSLPQRKSEFKELDKMLKKIYDTFIVNVDKLTDHNIRLIIGKLRDYAKVTKNEKTLRIFHNPQFIDALAESMTQREFDLETCFILLRYIQTMKHKNMTFLKHVLKIFLQTHSEGKLMDSNKSLYGFYALIHAMASANLQSKELKKMLDSMNFDLVIEKFPPEVLVTLSLNLAVLDFYNQDLMQKVFDNWRLYQKNDTQHWAYYKLWQKISVDPNYQGPSPTTEQMSSLPTLYQSSKLRSSVLSTLIRVLGDKTLIESMLRTKLHHEIDHVICYRRGGFPVPLDASESTYIEDLPIVPESILILIKLTNAKGYFENTGELMGCQAVYFKTLEALSPTWKIIKVREDLWEEMSEKQRTMFIMEEIKSKLKIANFDNN